MLAPGASGSLPPAQSHVGAGDAQVVIDNRDCVEMGVTRVRHHKAVGDQRTIRSAHQLPSRTRNAAVVAEIDSFLNLYIRITRSTWAVSLSVGGGTPAASPGREGVPVTVAVLTK